MSPFAKEYDLQWKLIYSVIVAGKSALFADAAISRLFTIDKLPLLQVADWGTVNADAKCREARTGNYGKLSRCLRDLFMYCPPLETCTPQELETIHGIGPKTSRFFILWTRPHESYAALDVHVLRWLKTMGYDVPRATPQSTKRYAEIEEQFLYEAAKRNVTPRQLDHAIWVEGAKHHERTKKTKALVKAVK